MNFSQVLNDQKLRLTSNNYVNIIWNNLQEANNESPCKEDENEYLYHLPCAFNEFLQNCVQKLRHSIKENDLQAYSNVDVKYLSVLIYHSLNIEDCANYTESVPLQAANLYILATLCKIFKCNHHSTFDVVFHKCLDVISCRVEATLEIDPEMLNDLNSLLILNPLDNNIENLIIVLYKIITTDNTEIFKNFYYANSTNKSFLSFCCLKALLENTANKNDEPKLVVLISRALLKCIEHNDCNNSSKLVLCTNVRKFFQIVLKPYFNCNWFMTMFNHFSKIYYNNKGFVEFINELSSEFYVKYTKKLTKDLFSSDDSCKLQIIAFHMLQSPPSNVDYIERKHLFTSLIQNIIFLFGHENNDIKECALERFENLLQFKDPMVVDIIMNIALNDHQEKMNISTIFNVLKQSVDFKWREKKFNKSFIKVACILIMKNPQYLTEAKIQYMEALCLKAPSVDFKSCTSVLLQLLRHFILICSNVSKFVLNVLIHHSCCTTTSTANYYVKELFELISEAASIQHSSNIAFEIVDLLISPLFDYNGLFKKIHGLNLLKSHMVKGLLEKIVFVEPRAWKLTACILEYIDYQTFPAGVNNYFQHMIQQHLFTLNHCGDMLGVFNKIIQSKIKLNVNKSQDIGFIKNIEYYLIESIQTHNMPIKYIGVALQLLNNIKEITYKSTEWLSQLFADLDVILSKLFLDIKLAENYERELTYIGEILIIFNYHLSERNKQCLVELFKTQNTLIESPKTWANLTILYGKMCIKEPEYIEDCIDALEYSLQNGPDYVQHCAMSALYDLCNIHLQYFDPLFPFLLNFLFSQDEFLRYTAGKLIIKLNVEGHLKLKYNHLISYACLLADDNLKIRSYFQKVTKEEFAKKNEQIIVMNFLQMVMHLNNYMIHNCFEYTPNIRNLQLKEYDRDKRNLIYKHLLIGVSKYNHLQLLDQITKEFLVPIIKQKIELSDNAILILFDLAFVIRCVCNDEEKEFYEIQMKMLSKDLAKKSHHIDGGYTKYEHNRIITRLIGILIQLCKKIFDTDVCLMQEIFHSALVITKSFYNNIIISLKEDGNQVRKVLVSLESFYTKNKGHLSCHNITDFK